MPNYPKPNYSQYVENKWFDKKIRNNFLGLESRSKALDFLPPIGDTHDVTTANDAEETCDVGIGDEICISSDNSNIARSGHKITNANLDREQAKLIVNHLKE